jgi:single-strand DNA-binding protein
VVAVSFDEGGGGGYSRPAARSSAPSAPASKPAAKSSTGFDDMDDDIPF